MVSNVYPHDIPITTAAAKSSHGKRKLSQTTRDDSDSGDNDLNPAYQHPDWLKKQRRKKPRGREDKQQKAASDTETIELMAEDITSSTQGIQQSNNGINAPELATSASSTHHNQSQGAHDANANIIDISSDEDERPVIRQTPTQGVATDAPDQTLQKQPQTTVSPFDEPSSILLCDTWTFRFRELRCSGQSSKPQAQPFHSSLSYTTSTSLRPRVSFGSSIPDG